ncbi:hypothetical protein [Halorussus salinus]|uniref:hypothetical protein n=1 Tax=Halorussus salinus TaxID=1364935 RepID=UPI0010929DA1|nr:hypothetical protein [Halorussus salinus]
MPSLHRRRVLHGAVALLGALAGCSDATTDRGSSSGASRPENVLYDPEAVWLRSSDRPRPLVWLPREEARVGDSSGDDSGSSSPPEDARQSAFVASRADADRLGVADEEGADAVRRFVAETDFERQTLYVENREVGACRAPELCSVAWSASDIHTEYARTFRDADVACRADERDATAVVIRIPDAIDPEEVNSHGSGWGRGCRSVPPLRRTANGTADARTTAKNSKEMTKKSQTVTDTSQTTSKISWLGVER